MPLHDDRRSASMDDDHYDHDHATHRSSIGHEPILGEKGTTVTTSIRIVTWWYFQSW